MALARRVAGTRLSVWLQLLVLLCGWTTLAWGAGGAFGERDFIRHTGKPVVEAVEFSGYDGSDYILTVYNGGRQRQFDPVTAAVITVNGSTLFSPDDFKQQVPVLTRQLTFAQANTLTVELRSKPGSGLTISIEPIQKPPRFDSTPPASALEDGPYEYSAHASDPNGDTLTYSLLQAPAGMQIDAATGIITWTPVNEQVGNQPVIIRVTDPTGLTDTQSFVVEVINTNDAPVITSMPVTSVNEDAPYRYVVQALDVDVGDTVHFQLQTAPAGMQINAATGELTWLPVNEDVGVHPVTVRVVDTVGAFDEQTFNLTVINVNDTPVINSAPIISTTEDQDYRYQVVALDPDVGDQLSYRLTEAPLGMAISATGAVSWLPRQIDVGDHTVTITVTDLAGASVEQTFSLTVINVNEPPVITSVAPVSVVAGDAYRYAVLATDEDGDPLTYHLVSAPAGMTLSPAGEITWVPAQTDVGDHPVTLLIDDGQGGSTQQSFAVTVLVPNLPPVITSTPASGVREESDYVYQATASDPNIGDVLTFSGLEGASGYAMSPAGLLQWTPDATLADAAPDADISCRVTSLPDGVVEPELKWHWSGSSTYPAYNQVMAAPVVAPTRDTNGDSKIDSRDAPSVLFATFTSGYYTSPGVLRVIDGATGTELWSRAGIVPGSTPAVADIDGDGKPEIVLFELFSGKAQITTLDSNGNVKWIYNSSQDPLPTGSPSYSRGAAYIADLDGDGKAEILIGPRVLNADGTLKWRDPKGYPYVVGNMASVAADIDLDGQQELIMGASAYKADGTRIFKNDAVGAGFVAVGNFNADAYPEIVVVIGGKVYLLDHLGKVIWSRAMGGSASLGGPPTIMDVDGDGVPEIGVASRVYYYVINADGSVRWAQPVQDVSSQSTGSTSMDLDGDGLMEIAYGDELNLRIYSADTGRVLYTIPNSSGTLQEYPVFADVDNDGHGDLVVVSNNYHFAGVTGVRVFSGKNNAWVPTRSLWNQYAYNINNINDDLSVPANPVKSWLTHNTYRLNSFPAFTALADVQVDSVTLDGAVVDATVRNRGYAPLGSSVQVRLFVEAPDAETLIGETTLPALAAKSEQTVEFPVESATLHGRLRVEAQPLMAGQECRENNNSAVASLFAIQVADAGGLRDQQQFAVSVKEVPVAPVFSSVPVTTTRAGLLYRYVAQASDANSADGRVYSLLTKPAGMSISPYTGLIAWLPTNAVAGENPVVVKVVDSSGRSATQAFTLTVLKNNPPVFTSTPPSTAVTGHAYSYQAAAQDPDGDVFGFALSTAPSGVTIDAQTGLVNWTSRTAGTFQLGVTVRDVLGDATTQSFSVSVTANQPPLFTSTPPAVAYAGELLHYQVTTADPEGDAVSYYLTSTPAGMSINSTTGLLSWQPTLAQLGQYSLRIGAKDTLGVVSYQDIALTVRSNAAPVIAAAPGAAFVSQGTTWSYQIQATDPDGDPLSYALVSGPLGVTVSPSGLVSWTPTATQQGAQQVLVSISDGRLTVQQTLTITAIIGQPPVVTSQPFGSAKVDHAWGYQILAYDPDGHALQYSLVSGPAGMLVSSTGLVTWLPNASQQGSQSVVIRVADDESWVEQAFSVNVLAATVPLAVSVTASPTTLDPGQASTISIAVSGVGAELTPAVTVNGQALALSATGKATFTPSTPGTYTITATVNDGYDTATSSIKLYVRDPSDTTPPVVSVLSPISVDKVTAPVDIVATITETNLKEYIVAISPAGRHAYREIARGTSAVEQGVVATFDPTLLTNGLWDILVQATDLNGQSGSEKVTVRVKGDLKLGHFAFTVTDVEVPLAGIPIRVTRTYDTRRKDENLDFGHGWSVGYQDGKVEESRPLGLYWDLNEYRSGPMNSIIRFCVEPRGKPVVTVTLPTGQVETFEVTVSNPCALYQPMIDGLGLTFTPIDNTLSTLAEEDPQPLALQNGALVDNGTLATYDPSLYKLTTKAGYVYHLDQGFGIRRIEDPNGNTITYTPNGILHSSGLSVLFDRDSDGRISAIHDPNGNVRRYRYDANGDLISADEPLPADSTATAAATSYRYYGEAEGFPHYLSEIHDPLGRPLLKNLYDNSGRLIAQEDGAGHRVEFAHNLSGRTSVVTNRRGFSTQYAYDDEGHILTQIDALGHTTTNQWDARGNLLQKTDPLGNTTVATYSDRNDVLTQTDGEGHTTTYTYNPRGQELTVTDALGHRYSMTYDTVGNLLTLTGPQQHVVGNIIGAKGLLEQTTDALGHSTRWTYDDQGRKLTETDALGHVTRFSYDSNGNVLTETRTRTVNGQAVTEVVSHTYDSHNRETSTTDALGNTTHTEYDLAGNVAARVDALGHRTEMTYDAYGHLTQTKYPDGTTETSTYDAEGNQTSRTDRLGRVTTYVYDALNRLVQTTYPE